MIHQLKIITLWLFLLNDEDAKITLFLIGSCWVTFGWFAGKKITIAKLADEQDIRKSSGRIVFIVRSHQKYTGMIYCKILGNLSWLHSFFEENNWRVNKFVKLYWIWWQTEHLAKTMQFHAE